MRVLLLVTAVAALAAAGTAAAGGFATVGLSPAAPDGAGPGTTWNVTLEVLQHGRTPLDGISPSVLISNLDTGETRTFAAAPTGEPGRYRAEVVFPAAGRWSYAVDDGFSQTHTFNPIAIVGEAPGSGSFPLAWTLAGSAAALLALTAAFLLVRRPPRRRPGLAVPSS